MASKVDQLLLLVQSMATKQLVFEAKLNEVLQLVRERPIDHHQQQQQQQQQQGGDSIENYQEYVRSMINHIKDDPGLTWWNTTSRPASQDAVNIKLQLVAYIMTECKQEGTSCCRDSLIEYTFISYVL